MAGLLRSGIVFRGQRNSRSGRSGAPRTTLSLDGQWDVEDSARPDDLPKTYGHQAPVPGLAHSALPTFADVYKYQSRELLSNLVRQGRYSKEDYEKLGDALAYRTRREITSGTERHSVRLPRISWRF